MANKLYTTMDFSVRGKPLNDLAEKYLAANGQEMVDKLVSKHAGGKRHGKVQIVVEEKGITEVRKLREGLPEIMDEESFKVFARSATPMLLARAIELAMVSESPKDVLAVAQAVAERGYGKVAQGIDVTVGDKVRRSWKELEEYKPLQIGGYVEEKIGDEVIKVDEEVMQIEEEEIEESGIIKESGIIEVEEEDGLSVI